MAPMQTGPVHPDALELAELLRPGWSVISAGIRDSGVPTCEGDAADADDDDAPESSADAGADAPAASADDDAPIKADDPWQEKARKHERDLKKERRAREKLEKELAQHAEASKSEQEKALDQARREAADAARSEVTKELRTERLTSAFARLAAAKVADVDDALKLLDVDEDEIYDDEGKVQTDALRSALDDLLERKPYLAARAPGPGENDAGKGSGRGKSAEDMSVEDHLAAIQRTK